MNRLEERVLRLEQEVVRLDRMLSDEHSAREIEALMNRYQAMCASQAGKGIVDKLWTADDDATLEYGASGVYQGLWKIATFYIKDALPGVFCIGALTTQRISVRGDSAEGSWLCLGMSLDAGELGFAVPDEGDRRLMLCSSVTEDGRRYKAEWTWQYIDVRFSREANSWRIHNMHVRDLTRCPFESDPVAFAEKRFATDGMWLESLFESPMPLPPESHGENLPSGPSSSHWQYTLSGYARDIERSI